MPLRSDDDLSLQQTAQILGMPVNAVERWVRKGVLPCMLAHGQPHFHRRDVEDWARRLGIPLRELPAAAAPGPAPVANPLVAALLHGGLVTDLPGATVEAVLRALAHQVELPGTLTVDALAEHLLARERLASTALGEGFALPHPRHPLGQHLREARLWVARLQQPIDFRSIDGKPVHTLLLLLSTSSKEHIELLARIAQVLRTPALRQLLTTARDLAPLCAALSRGEG
jgi:PTS system nitrogen regulatory IIA component